MKWDFTKYPRIELALNNAGRLILRNAGPNAVVANVFTGEQIQSLWNTIVKSGLDVDASSVTLFDGLQENGRLRAAEASKTRESGSNLAYEGWQLAAFVPVKIEMRVNYAKPQLAVMSIERVNTRPDRPQAPVLSLTRVPADGEAPAKQQPGKKITRAE